MTFGYMLYSACWFLQIRALTGIWPKCCQVRASLVAQLVKNPPTMQETLVWLLGWEDPLKGRVPTPLFLGCPGGSAGKESAHNVGNLGSISGLGRSLGEGNSILAWRIQDYTVHGFCQVQPTTRLWVAGGLATSHVPFKQCSEWDVMFLLKKVIRGDGQQSDGPFVSCWSLPLILGNLSS